MYTKTNWQDRIVEFPKRFAIIDNGDGTVTLERVEGQVLQAGTPVSATNLQKMEDEIARLSGLVDQHQLDISNLKTRMNTMESVLPENFLYNKFDDDLSSISSIRVIRGYYNEAQSRLEV